MSFVARMEGRPPGQVSMKSVAQVLAKLAPSTPTPFCSNGVTKQILPFFEFLQLLGRCPLSFETVEDPHGCRRVKYEFKFCRDPRFAMSVVVAVVTTVCCIVGAYHSQSNIDFLGDLWPSRKRLSSKYHLGTTPMVILSIFEISYALIIVVEYFIVWCTFPALSKWLNTWNDIEMDAENCPGMTYNVNLSKFLKYFAIPYIGLPTLAFGTLISMSEYDIKHPVGIVIITVQSYFATLCIQAEDVKVVVMFKAMELSFQQVRKSIQFRYDTKSKFTNNFYTLGKQEILTWKAMLIKIRKQAAAAGKYLAVHQLISISTCIFSASAALFLSANLIGEQPGNETLPIVAFFTIISFMRVFIKIFMAVRITEEESNIASLLRDLELIEDNKECQNELKGIFEMLVHCPTVISLNDYVRLNNPLILSICGQVLTQFIVYQQFKTSKSLDIPG